MEYLPLIVIILAVLKYVNKLRKSWDVEDGEANEGDTSTPASIEEFEDVDDNFQTEESSVEANIRVYESTLNVAFEPQLNESTASKINADSSNRSSSTKHQSPQVESAYSMQKSTQKHGIMSDFDLRKAVVYAEILTPKWKE